MACLMKTCTCVIDSIDEQASHKCYFLVCLQSRPIYGVSYGTFGIDGWCRSTVETQDVSGNLLNDM